MNKSELVSRLTARLDGDRTKAVEAVNGVLEEIGQSLARGEKVSLVGFGTFDRRERGPRTARNPATGETIQVGASVAPVFRAGAGLRQVLADAAGTARTAAADAAKAAAAIPAAAVSVIVPPSESTKKDGTKKASSKKASSKKAPSNKVSSKKASTKAAQQVSDKGGPKKAKANDGKAAKKSSGKGAKKG